MENQPKLIRFNCWGNSGRSPFAAEVADMYLIKQGLDGLCRATSAGVGVTDMQYAARNARQFAMDPTNKRTIRDILSVGLARADRKILFAGADDAAERYLNGDLTELTPGQVGELVNVVRNRCSYEEREARATAAEVHSFRTDLSHHTPIQTTPKVGILIDFAMDSHVLERLELMWKQADGALRPRLIVGLGPYATEDSEFSFNDESYGKLEKYHHSYLRFAEKVIPAVKQAIDRAQKEGLLS